jgi:guanylate kinase
MQADLHHPTKTTWQHHGTGIVGYPYSAVRISDAEGSSVLLFIDSVEAAQAIKAAAQSVIEHLKPKTCDPLHDVHIDDLWVAPHSARIE